MLTQILPALRATILFTVVTGLVYPGIVTGLCQLLFRDKANGSLVRIGGQVVGSSLLGQNFSRPEYFHSRPSAAGAAGYDATASGGSNLGPTNQKLYDRVKASADNFRTENPSFVGSIPSDALTASASGLDPHISLANAAAQAARVAQPQGASAEAIQALLNSVAERRDLGFLGEARINVLAANMELVP
jgi:K+-transporting ATPase ATPase C chain